MQTEQITVDWKTIRKHIYASKYTPKEIKELLTTFFEAGDWNICIDGAWLYARPFEPPISNIEMLTDMQFRGFTITLPVERKPFSGPPYSYCFIDIDTETGEVYLRCLTPQYRNTKLDLDAKLLARYIMNRIKLKLKFLEKL